VRDAVRTVVLAALLGMVAARAHAAELRFSAPDSCPDAAAVQQQVERLSGVALADVTTIDFEVRIERGIGERWRLVMRTVPRTDERSRAREIAGASCDEVADAAAVAIAMTIAEQGQRDAAPPATAPPGTAVAAEPVAPAAAPASPAQSPPGPAEWRFGMALGLALDTGTQPAPAPGGQLELFAGVGAMRLVVLGTFFTRQKTRLRDDERGGEFQLVVGALLICAEPVFGRLRALGCGGYEIGVLSGMGIEIEHPRGRGVLWHAARLEAGGALELGQGIGLIVRAGAALPPSTRPFAIEEVGVVHEPSAVSFRALGGVEVTF
jgi:hypothetical protein